MGNNVVLPVSYTHLDVYKRQLQYSAIHEYRRGGNQLDQAPHEANVAEQADHREGVDLRMLLEGPHRIDDDGDIVYGHELLGNVLSHAVADTAVSQ